jgi:phenylacetic acid degradation operon negative regulatory protein
VNDVLRRRSVGAPAARSMLLTVLGEYALPRHEGLWQESLVSALTTVGYSAAAARQAVVRSTKDGWLSGERIGRRSRMRLTEPTRELLRGGAARIYGFGGPVAWDRRWLLVVLRVPENRRELRYRVKTQLAWAGFGSLGGGLWVTPHVTREHLASQAVAQADPEIQALSFRAELGDLGDPSRVIGAAWDLPTLRAQYEQFVDDFSMLEPEDDTSTFAAQTNLVHAWRRFPFIDPDLPDEVLDDDWPRRRAHELFRDRHERWNRTAQEHFDRLAGDGDAAGARRAVTP